MPKFIYRCAYPALLLAALLTALAGCSARPPRLGQDQVRDIAWRALEPYTSSQSRSNWELRQAQKVAGRDVVGEFTLFGARKCPGPTPPENLAIRASSEYWYIQAIPKPRDENGEQTISANTPEALTPEPILKEATFLVDPFSGQVVARKFFCGE